MNKDFLKMTPEERDAEAKRWENGIDFGKTKPLSKNSQKLWELAKRGRGRPSKPADKRVRRVLISIEPKLLAAAEAFASSNGLDRSKLFALSLEAFIGAERAHRQASSKCVRSERKRKAGPDSSPT
jgi:hypothetical protein